MAVSAPTNGTSSHDEPVATLPPPVPAPAAPIDGAPDHSKVQQYIG